MFTYNQDVVELLHTIDLGQQLVDDGVMDTGAACHAASLLANGINLIENDDVKSTISSQLKKINKKRLKQMHNKEL